MGEKEIHRMLPEGRENAERGLFAGNETVNESARGLEVDGMKETMERVARDDFYESRGITCMCCPNGISRQNAECMRWRDQNLDTKGRHAKAAGRYPVDKHFPCEACGRVEEHRH